MSVYIPIWTKGISFKAYSPDQKLSYTDLQKKLLLFSNKRIEKEFGKLRLIDNEWFDWILAVSTNFNDYERFVGAIIQITYLFAKGMLKNSPSCIPTMSRREKEDLFKNIENTLNKRG